MKFEAGKTYYGIDPGESASWREITILAIEDGEIAARIVDLDRKVRVSIFDEEGDSWMTKYYQETPWYPEFKAGDRVVIDFQNEVVSHYILREKWTNQRPDIECYRTQWVALRIHKNGTTRLTVLDGAYVENATPYKK